MTSDSWLSVPVYIFLEKSLKVAIVVWQFTAVPVEIKDREQKCLNIYELGSLRIIRVSRKY